ncbi:hypothetical protein FJ930_28065 [Mesorhizobium sp. B2-4-15]|uniref:hypothetical protein n=1 Tax=Mesorhizobium sp. B2-4-15 TaxID=2589934 RepID=UPI00114DF7C6|nr:hypothetical protein [Mesorhizobium sp. B2-4-15]TPK60902.1 hypothetical protein FJ930_28065 [Mesorhizobium sp. B2-4-15]
MLGLCTSRPRLVVELNEALPPKAQTSSANWPPEGAEHVNPSERRYSARAPLGMSGANLATTAAVNLQRIAD